MVHAVLAARRDPSALNRSIDLSHTAVARPAPPRRRPRRSPARAGRPRINRIDALRVRPTSICFFEPDVITQIACVS